jgi:hypothetical protein
MNSAGSFIWDAFGTPTLLHWHWKYKLLEVLLTSPNTRRAQHLFVVRMWLEPSRIANASWRGSVEHVPSGQRLYFTSLADLNDFIHWRLQQNQSSENTEKADS